MSGSLGYAERLKHRVDLGGQLGANEYLDSVALVAQKSIQLAALLKRAKESGRGCVVHTGAGISTSCGIPDFRGPQGIWTLQKKGFPIPQASCRFDRARPSLTHMALVTLQANGYIRYLVSCNVDSLHIRSGFPRNELAELHGNCFAERCESCEFEYVRDFEMSSVGFKRTKRKCLKCGGSLRDQVLDWEDALPQKELKLAELHSKDAALSLVLGSSLQITPSCNIPLKTVSKRKDGKDSGKLVIVNLQKTPKDKHAALLIHAKVDEVMSAVMSELGLTIPNYTRKDSFRVSHSIKSSKKMCANKKCIILLRLGSEHGFGCPLPWIQSVSLALEVQTLRDIERETINVSEHIDEGGCIEAPHKFEWKCIAPIGCTIIANFTCVVMEGCCDKGHEMVTASYVCNLADDVNRPENNFHEGTRFEFVTSTFSYGREVEDLKTSEGVSLGMGFVVNKSFDINGSLPNVNCKTEDDVSTSKYSELNKELTTCGHCYQISCSSGSACICLASPLPQKTSVEPNLKQSEDHKNKLKRKRIKNF